MFNDGGILGQAQKAKEQQTKGQALEEVNLAVGSLFIKQNVNPVTQEEKRAYLEGQLKQIQLDSTVAIAGNGFTVNHRGYEIQVDDNYQVSVKGTFVADEWDKLAATEDCFQWGSNTPGEEGYNIIVGYTEKAQNYTKLRIPSRCKRIVCDGSFLGVSDGLSSIGRAFIKNIREIEIPSTVSDIGRYAFSYEDSTALEKLTIPSCVTSIGYGAFSYCESLTNVTVPSSVTSSGGRSFSHCTSLTTVTMGFGVASNRDSSFTTVHR